MSLLNKTEKVLKDTWAFVKNVWHGLGTLLTIGIVGLLIVVLASYLLNLTRTGFFQAAPVIIRHSHLWDTIIMGIATAFVVVVDSVILIIHVIDRIRSLFGHQIVAGSLHHYKPLPNITAVELRNTLRNWTSSCVNVRNPTQLIALSAKLSFGDDICPYLRASYPLGFPGEAFRWLTQWASPPSDPVNGNCYWPPHSPGWPCVVLGSGFVLFDILLPLIIILIVVGVVGVKNLFKIIIDSIGLLLAFIKTIVKFLRELLHNFIPFL